MGSVGFSDGVEIRNDEVRFLRLVTTIVYLFVFLLFNHVISMS